MAVLTDAAASNSLHRAPRSPRRKPPR
jgi:hypothetical protein